MEVSSNILIYNTTFFEGSETFIYNQYRAFSDYSSLLVAHDFKNLDRFVISPNTKKLVINQLPEGLKNRFFHFLRRKWKRTNYLLPTSTNKELESAIKSQRIKVVHAHFGPNGLYILPFCIKNSLPLVVSFHGYDASKLLLNEQYRSQLNLLFEYASSIVVCAEKMKRDLLSATADKYASKIQVVHYGVDIEMINQVEKPLQDKLDQNCVKIIHAGRLTPKKGILDLIQVFQLVQLQCLDKEVILEIVGNGEEMVAAKQLTEDLGLSKNVIFYGAVSHLQLLAYVKSADIFVLNSRVSAEGDSEGFPNSILEAMASKTAVLSTNHAGIPEVVEDNETGLLVEEFDNSGLEEALVRLVKNNEERERLVSKAFFKVNQFSISVMNEKLNNLIATL
jgi:colanic acid/amylovoran biosynthesis glycosyltransferase